MKGLVDGDKWYGWGLRREATDARIGERVGDLLGELPRLILDWRLARVGLSGLEGTASSVTVAGSKCSSKLPILGTPDKLELGLAIIILPLKLLILFPPLSTRCGNPRAFLFIGESLLVGEPGGSVNETALVGLINVVNSTGFVILIVIISGITLIFFKLFLISI